MPGPLVVRDSVRHRTEPRGDEAIAPPSGTPLLSHETGIKQDAEVLGDGRAAHLEVYRRRRVPPQCWLADSRGGPHASSPWPRSARGSDPPDDEPSDTFLGRGKTGTGFVPLADWGVPVLPLLPACSASPRLRLPSTGWLTERERVMNSTVIAGARGANRLEAFLDSQRAAGLHEANPAEL